MKLYLTFFVIAVTAFFLLVAASKSVGASERLLLRVDQGTGCHYLATRDGGLTPRMSGSGKQMGCSDE